LPDSRVLIITDREELDDQIEKLFKGVGETNISRASSGADLVTRLNRHEDVLMCSLIHKFGKHEGEPTEDDYDKYIEEIKKSLPKNFEVKGNFFVFVDECHRTQSGKLHAAMKTILPKAIFVGFTGTPLLKKDKTNSIEVFGSFIHTYKFNEAVEDGIFLNQSFPKNASMLGSNLKLKV
jgi:type I restriction enzyme R subunit